MSDKLDILKMMLMDWHNAPDDTKKILSKKGTPVTGNHVLISHEAWVLSLKDVSKNTDQAGTQHLHLSTCSYYPLLTTSPFPNVLVPFSFKGLTVASLVPMWT